MTGPHLVIAGPTASGKSALALAVARCVPDVEIVAVDSMQVYRGMNIGTAKPTPAERAEVRHHLLDLADPAEDFTVARFQTAFRTCIADVEGRGKRAVLVAGTGLYLRAVVDELDVPGQFPAVRHEVEAEPDTEALHARLGQLDPVAAGRMTPVNRRRVVRALEVTIGSGRPFSSFGPGLDHYPPTRFRMTGIWLPTSVLAERIERRLNEMVADGLVDEVRRLGPMSRTARQALGYKELLAHVEQGVPLRDAVEEAVRRTRAFARRQRVWFRRDPRIAWLGSARNPVEVLPALLGDWTRCPPC